MIRAWIGIVLAACAVLMAALGPLAAPHDPTQFVGAPFAGPAHRHLLGTDFLGQDVLSRLLWGGRSILWMAVAATAIGALAGIAIGATAGSSHPWVDDVLMAGSDVVLSFPQLVLALLFVSIHGPRLWLIVLVVGLSHAPRIGRLTRSLTLELRGREFVQAAELLGVPRQEIFAREVLPNILQPLGAEIGVRLAWSVIFIAGLSFLGLGVQPPNADWGRMVNENRDGLTTQPWAVLVPVALIALFTVGTNLLCSSLAVRRTRSAR